MNVAAPQNGFLRTFRLVPILEDGGLEDTGVTVSPDHMPMLQATAAFYAAVGYAPPWISYVSVADGMAVGGGSFVGEPINGAVEIAYYTLPERQGRGHAGSTAAALVELAIVHAPEIAVWAKTLPAENPSTRVLERLGFRRDGTAVDHEIGLAWRWTLSF